MALNETGQRPEAAEERAEVQAAHNPTTLEKLRSFAGSRARVLALLAAVATPIAGANCARPAPVEQKEQESSIRVNLNVIQENQVGMVGVKAFINMEEPLNQTHIELFDDVGNSIYEAANMLDGTDGREISFVEEGYQRGSEIAVPGGKTIRSVVVTGRNARGELVQTEALLNSEWLNDTDPFPNE